MRVAILLAFFFASCTPATLYMESDRDTYQLIAPAHAAYVQADTRLTAEEKVVRQLVLDSWRLRWQKGLGGQ